MRRDWLQVLAYGLPGLPLALLGLPLVLFLPSVYAEDFALGFTMVGVVLLLARCWDLLSDPLVGYLADRLVVRNRRRIMMLAGTPLLLLGVHRVFVPPGQASADELLFWLLLLYTGWSMVTVPYLALGAELSSDYNRRSRLSASREGFVLMGTLAAALLPLLAGLGGADRLEILGWTFLLLLPLSLFAVFLLREPVGGGTQLPFTSGLRLLRDNRAFRLLLWAYLANGLANAIPATLFVLYVQHWLQRPDLTWLFLALYLVAGLVGMLLWLPWVNRIGKHRVWALSIFTSVAAFLAVPWLPQDAFLAYALVCGVTGLSLGVDMSLPSAIQADVIDLDRAAGGGERAGLFAGLWGMATKLALTMAVGLAFPLLDLLGFSLTDGQPSGLAILPLLYGLLPIPFKIMAGWIAWRFPLDRHLVGVTQRSLADDKAVASLGSVPGISQRLRWHET